MTLTAVALAVDNSPVQVLPVMLYTPTPYNVIAKADSNRIMHVFYLFTAPYGVPNSYTYNIHYVIASDRLLYIVCHTQDTVVPCIA